MKHMKKCCLTLISIFFVFGCTLFPTSASTSYINNDEIIYFDDGSYLVIELTSESNLARSTTSGGKNASFHNADGDLLWVIRVEGSFYYTGTTAIATSATYSYQIYDSAWSLKEGRAYCSGNQAIAECTFTGGIFLTRNATVVLSCSPTGVLS